MTHCLDQVHAVKDAILSEKIVRLPNGFATTQRELDEFEAQQARNHAKVEEFLSKNVTIKQPDPKE